MKKKNYSHAAGQKTANAGRGEESEKTGNKSSLRTLGIFCVIVGIILLISLSYKALLLVKNSRFDGKSGFILSMSDERNKNIIFYGFDPAAKSLSLLKLKSSTGISDPGKQLHIPIDGTLHKKRIVGSSDFALELTSYSLYTPQKNTDISVLDAVRFWIFSKSIGNREFKKEEIVLPSDMEHVTLQVKRMKIFILDGEKQYLGMLPDDVGRRLLDFINGGNEYEAYVKTIDNLRLIVFIKETKRSLRFKNQPSFPSFDKVKFSLDGGGHGQKASRQNKQDPDHDDDSGDTEEESS